MNIIGKRYLFFTISLIVIISGMIALALWGLPLAIDFSGGSLLQISFDNGVTPAPADMISLYDELGISGAQVQTSGNGSMVIRSKVIEEEVKSQIVKSSEEKFGTTITINRFETVGPSIGKEVASRALLAVSVAAIGILLYITYAFRDIPHAGRYGIAAILGVVHDILVVLGITAILCHFLGWEVDSLFLTALLTITGFSVQDTIVVFDRVRENQNIYRKVPYETIVNHSVVQTMDRSIINSLTPIFTLLAMALFGGVTIRQFVIILLIGMISGTYSSTFFAAPIVVLWENKEWKTWFKKKQANNSLA